MREPITPDPNTATFLILYDIFIAFFFIAGYALFVIAFLTNRYPFVNGSFSFAIHFEALQASVSRLICC
jgi:hypothetical protein